MEISDKSLSTLFTAVWVIALMAGSMLVTAAVFEVILDIDLHYTIQVVVALIVFFVLLGLTSALEGLSNGWKTQVLAVIIVMAMFIGPTYIIHQHNQMEKEKALERHEEMELYVEKEEKQMRWFNNLSLNLSKSHFNLSDKSLPYTIETEIRLSNPTNNNGTVYINARKTIDSWITLIDGDVKYTPTPDKDFKWELQMKLEENQTLTKNVKFKIKSLPAYRGTTPILSIEMNKINDKEEKLIFINQ